MPQSHITPLPELTEALIAERCAQVELEMDRNPDRFLPYAQRRASYLNARAHLEQLHPEARMEIDDLASSILLMNASIHIEVYKQGMADGAALLHFMLTHGKTPKEEVL